MHLDSALARVSEHLQAAAALGDDRTRDIATALSAAVTPAVRLALLEAVSAAADEITAALLDYPGSPAVSTRLDGDDVAIEVRATTGSAEAPPAEDGEATARISLRLSEGLKGEIDSAAERAGVSVNAWLVRAASVALHAPRRPGPFGDAGAPPFRGGPFGRGRFGDDSHRITGWVTG